MKYIDNLDHMDATLNLALEEYILTQLDINETYLLFYSMSPTVIVGKNQNTFEEINMDFIKENNIAVTRRLSGGGAVYNDEGDLSFSFITKDDGDSFHNYRKFTEPVIRALHQMGVQAELQGRNDLAVGDKKISGNAQFSTRGRMFSHGTLLFDVNLENVARALNPDAEKYLSKGIKSVRARVTNIREHLNKEMTIKEFKQTLLRYIFEGEEEIPEYKLTEEDWQHVREIRDQRYRNWDWVYGKSPTFNVKQKHRFPSGTVDVRLKVTKGMIEEAKIYGDFFGVGDIEDIEKRLIGVRYDRERIAERLSTIDVEYYLGKISKHDLLGMMF
ncbi:lipoate--protein ligase [Pullulanibacillus sp. KACC 23026]|uniref:lipoate--protein ligase n=1 Tax=Pullulanibacillus sp. KACC 23026 TaxID=3028315 RepID=UPI0023AF459B|nr:lipoate--protein ligase [Pullulanibacillus sp. KACC 23026]WEG11015.1 lipoate--protein ligase [Pullulanibacillus sp. KACC 23026]